MNVSILQEHVCWAFGDAESIGVGLDVAQCNLRRLSNDLSELSCQLKIALAWHGL
jgi:hypothetical protein